VSIRFRRFSSGAPWYSEGTVFLNPGQNTVFHGGPSAYLRLEVMPAVPSVLRAT
jgi:hypothetical protein